MGPFDVEAVQQCYQVGAEVGHLVGFGPAALPRRLYTVCGKAKYSSPEVCPHPRGWGVSAKVA
jgi:hypothetical protein